MLNHAIDISNFKMHGVYDISSEEYHSSEGISRSSLMHFMKTPFHYYNEFLNINSLKSIKDSDSIKIGSLFHTYVLEPEKLQERYIICEKHDRRTKDGKEYYDKLTLLSKGKELINSDDFEKVKLMADIILKDNKIRQLIEGAKYEKSIYWTDKHTDLICKVRPDIWQNNFICDIKTTISADYRSFQRSLYNYGYHIQCAMMYEAFKNVFNIEMTNFIFIVVENTWPHAFAIYQLDQASLEQSVSIFKNKLLEMKQCFDKKEWPSYKTQVITLPNYILGE